MQSNVLIIDDEISICVSLQIALEGDYAADYALTAADGLSLLEKNRYDAVLLDLRIGECSGIDVLKQIKSIDPQIMVILMTAYGSIDTCVEAIRNGAFTYMLKPLQLDEVRVRLQQAIEYRNLHEQVQLLQEKLDTERIELGFVGQSPAMKKVYSTIQKLSNTSIGITILGESGTGKELAARAIHQGSSRSHKRFVALNCAAIPENLIEDELFGHKKGAFTGASEDRIGCFLAADGGTLFLDEIGDMPLPMQSKLLRVTQNKQFAPIGSTVPHTVDVRIIAATNKNLEKMVANGEFRQDLYFRLCVATITMPPLRDRRQDIPLLCQHFLDQYNREYCKNVRGMTKEALNILMQYAYPGNVRELSNIIEYAVAISDGDVIELENLPERICGFSPRTVQFRAEGSSQMKTLQEIEQEAIYQRLNALGWKRQMTADSLGISVRGLRNKIDTYNLVPPK